MAGKTNLKDKTVLVLDCGLFVEIAIKLSKEFKKVYYYTEWRSSFPSKRGVMIGEGFDEIERVNDWMSKIDEVDLFVFPDVYYGSEQVYLRSIGKNVFGGGHGDELELWRNEAKKHFKSLGLPVSPYKVLVGLDKLREYLKTKKNQFVKISCYRGDFETWHHEEYKLSEPMLDKMERSLGVMKDDYEFVVEEALDGEDIVEAGSDLFTVDGKYPDKVISGFEIKDLGYVGAVKEYSKISPLVTGFNDKISKTLKDYTYRGFMSTEIRVGKDKIPYMIDFCARAGSPPNELYQEMISNLGEVMWYAAQGILVQPKYAAKYGIECLIHSDWASDEWQAVYYPKEINQWVKLRNACRINGIDYVVPQNDGLPEIGAVIAIGDSVDECIEKVKGYAEQVKGYRLDIKTGSIENMKEVLEKAKRIGISID